VQVKTSTGTVLSDEKHTYDALDRRIGVTTTSSGVTSSIWTAYNGSDPYADFNASGTLTTRYLHAEATDALLARIGATGTLAWYITDVAGSVREVVDASGNILDRISYDPFGQVTLETSPSQGDRFKYDGGAFSITTVLNYFNARYYDAARGVWISQDPTEFWAGDANLSRYVGNDPMNMVDPSGLQANKAGVPILKPGVTGYNPAPDPVNTR
jgi:RHS repeat-associated protein